MTEEVEIERTVGIQRVSKKEPPMINFLNDITGGHLLLWKVVLTSIVFALAGLQVVMAARFWGRPFLVALSPGTAVRVHRMSGRLALTLGVLVALTCIVGPAGPL